MLADGDPACGVGARLTALSLDRNGRLTSQLMPSAAVRCGVLFDLARLGRLRLRDDAVELDATPTGLPAVDDLLLAMGDEPDRTLDSWFGERRFGVTQVADALVRANRWRRQTAPLRRARYRTEDPGQRERDLRLDVTRTEPDWEASDAAVAALAVMANLLGELRHLGLRIPPPAIPDQVFAAVGDHEWVLRAAVEHLAVARTRYVLGASALG